MQLLNGFILLLLAAGHAELLVTLVNRSHSLPIRPSVLRHVRHVHDGLIFVFPIVLFVQVGFRGPGLLLGGSWGALPVGWAIWLTLCAVGLVGLLWSTLRWQLRRPPGCRVHQSATVTLPNSGEIPPVGDGPYHFLTRVPFNQFLELEVVEKVYDLARLPSGRGPLRVLHLSDLHFTGSPAREFYEGLTDVIAQQEYDLAIFTGDLLDDEALHEWIPLVFGRISARYGQYYILGNHDWYLDQERIRADLNELGWRDVAGTTVTTEAAGIPLVLGGSEWPWMGRHPDFAEAPEDALRILLSHTPDNLAWARGESIDLMLSGHNHGGQVILPVIGPVYSPSWSGVKYSGGDYFREPTLLHVSRGLGAKHPLRINCRPELPTLVLQ